MIGPFEDAFSRQKDRLFLWFPVFLGLGIAAYFSLKSEPALYAGLVLMGVIVILAILSRHRRPVLIALGFVGLAALGFSLAQFRTHWVATPMLVKETGPRSVEGIISDIEMLEPGKGSRVVLDHVSIEDIPPSLTPHKIRLRLRDHVEVKAGQRIRVLAGLSAPSSPVAPGAFDFQRYLYFHGIGASGFTYGNPEVVEERARTSLFITLEDARQVIARRTAEALHPAYAPFGIALLTGQQAAVAEADKEALRDSSMAHLLAISGMNIAMVFGAVFFMLRLVLAALPPVALHSPIKKYAAVAAFSAAVAYTCIVGGDVPVMRALLMSGVITVAILADRSPFSPRLLAFAALVLLMVAPENLVNVSFQLSFAAVGALIFFFDATRHFWLAGYARAGWIRRIFFYLLGIFATTVVAGLATAPIILYHFQNFAVYGVLANMIGVPLMGFIVMPAGVLSYLLIPLGWEGPAMNVMEWGISWIMATAHWTAGLEGSVWHVRALPLASFALMVAGSLFALLWNGRERWAGVLLIVLGLAFIPLTRAPDIIIAESFKLIGLRGHDGTLSVSSGRADKFAAENWMRLNGEGKGRPPVWPREGRAENAGMICADEGCRAEIRGYRLAFPRSPSAMAEDCTWADVIVASRPLPDECRSKVALDLFDGMRNGSYALWLNEKQITVRSSFMSRGRRPWTRYAGDQ